MEDHELMHLMKTEPEIGIERFIGQYAGLIYSIVAGRTRNAASEEDIEECVSDIVFEIYQKSDTIDLKKGSLQAWTSVVAKNRAINLYKKKTRELIRQETMGNPELEDCAADSEQAVLNADERWQLLETVRRLGEPDSTIIFRKYFFGQRSREIAQDMGMTVSAVDTRLSRAIVKLRSMWGGKE